MGKRRAQVYLKHDFKQRTQMLNQRFKKVEKFAIDRQKFSRNFK